MMALLKNSMLLFDISGPKLSNSFKFAFNYGESNDQTVYVPGEFVGESTRLSSDLLEYMDYIQ